MNHVKNHIKIWKVVSFLHFTGTEVHSEPRKISRMKSFVKQSFTISAKSSVLDVWLGSKYASVVVIDSQKVCFEKFGDSWVQVFTELNSSLSLTWENNCNLIGWCRYILALRSSKIYILAEVFQWDSLQLFCKKVYIKNELKVH